jgi:hypothetical protein
MGFKRLAAAAAMPSAMAGQMPGVGSLARGASKAYDKATAGPQFNAPAIDQGVLDISKRQMQRAKDFRGGMEGNRQEQFGQAEGASRQGLAKSMSANTQNYNSRGLLFSGMRAGGEADAQTESASKLAGAKADINQNLEQTASGLDQQAFESGSKIAELNNQNAAQQQQFDQQAAQQRNSGIGGFLRLGAAISGGYNR